MARTVKFTKDFGKTRVSAGKDDKGKPKFKTVPVAKKGQVVSGLSQQLAAKLVDRKKVAEYADTAADLS